MQFSDHMGPYGYATREPAAPRGQERPLDPNWKENLLENAGENIPEGSRRDEEEPLHEWEGAEREGCRTAEEY